VNRKTHLLKRMIREEVRRQVNEAFPYDDPVYTELVSLDEHLKKVIEAANKSNYNNVSRAVNQARDMVVKAAKMMEDNKQ